MPANFGTLHLDCELLLTARLGKFFDNLQVLPDSILNIGNRFCLGFSLGVTPWEPWNGHSKSFVRFVNDNRVFQCTSPNLALTNLAVTLPHSI